jgi:hypothetical protein
LLDLLLGSHPAAMSLGEITQLPKNLALNTVCSCGDAVRECVVWRAVTQELGRREQFRGLHSDPYRLHLGLFKAGTVIDHEHQTVLRELYRKLVYAGAYAYWRWGLPPLATLTGPLRQGANNKWSLFQVIAESVSRPVLIDSSKHYLEAIALYESEPRRTKVLLLVRDGRAVFYSGLKRGQRRQTALNAWRRTYRRAIPVLSRRIADADLLIVKYEDLAANPARELHRICQFIGIGFDVGMLDFGSRTHHVLSGNNMRFARSNEIRVDEVWKRELSRANLAYFDARGGALNRELGY